MLSNGLYMSFNGYICHLMGFTCLMGIICHLKDFLYKVIVGVHVYFAKIHSSCIVCNSWCVDV